MNDLIERQAAINAIGAADVCVSWYGDPDDDAIELAIEATKRSVTASVGQLPSAQPELTEMIKEIRKWINSGNRGHADYFIVDKIEEILNKYE